MRVVTYVLILIVAVMGIVFASLNPTPVVVHYVFASSELPVSVLVVASLGVGLLMGLLVAVVVYFKLKRHVFQLKGHIKIIQQEVNNLRSLPIREPH